MLFLYLIAHSTLAAAAASVWAQAAGESPYYARVNSFGVFVAYSGDSSHILLGDAENRMLFDVGVSYSRKLLLNRHVNWQYSGEILPVALESDPNTHVVENVTSPIVATYTYDTLPSVSCATVTTPFSIVFTNPEGGTTTYTGTYTDSCSGRRWTIGEAMSPVGFQWSFLPRNKLQPFFIAHGGYMYSTQPIPVPEAGSFNFTFDLGAGFELYRTKTHSIRAECRYHHISNHNTAAQSDNWLQSHLRSSTLGPERDAAPSRNKVLLEEMPPILNAQSVTKQFGAKPLFRNISLTVEDGDRIGLIGPNGAGKSTLLALLAGQVAPDSGELAVRKRARAAYVPQDSRFAVGLTIRQVLERALASSHGNEIEREGRLRELSGRAGFADLNTEAAALSGGWRKRLAITEALVGEPEVLLLDEPTNHLDLAGIEWLEELLASASFAAVTVSHDRYFLESTSSQIVELNRVYADGLLRVKGNFSRFLEEKQAYLESQNRQEESLRNRVKTEIEWLRRGPKARTTKSKARIDSANRMIGQLAEMNSRTAVNSAGIDFEASQRKTKRLVELSGVALAVPDSSDFGPRAEKSQRLLFSGLNFILTAGMKLGLVGPNGSGKTTLLRLLRGEVEPAEGSVRRAEALRLVYFSQMRELDESLTLRRALAPEGDSVLHQGRVVHVASWAARFLFPGEQLNQPVRNLSGGERARVLIAKLMLEPADVLLLDEPTNDLDIPTLDILEENLLDFPGALVLVTHDRYLLNRVASTVLGLDGRGRTGQFADYAQWEDWIEQQDDGERGSSVRRADGSSAVQRTGGEAASASGSRKKLSYLEAREFAAIEQRVEQSDARLAAARNRIEHHEIATDATALQGALRELDAAQQENDGLYARWAELTEKAG
jgi:ATP-binding cassette subfamily F protein uup